MDNAEQETIVLKGRLQEINSAGGESNKSRVYHGPSGAYWNLFSLLTETSSRPLHVMKNWHPCSSLQVTFTICVNKARDRRVLVNPKFFPPLFLCAKVLK